jgi:hypothetical protein
LRERKEVRDDAARLAAPIVREAREHGGAERRRKNKECHGVVGCEHRESP